MDSGGSEVFALPLVGRHGSITSNAAFIREVRGHLVLWDTEHPDHNNRPARLDAWEAICRRHDKAWDDRPPDYRDDTMASLQRRWKNLKDAFSREVKKRQVNRTLSGRQRKPYTHYHLMTFLLKGGEEEVVCEQQEVREEEVVCERQEVEEEEVVCEHQEVEEEEVYEQQEVREEGGLARVIRLREEEEVCEEQEVRAEDDRRRRLRLILGDPEVEEVYEQQEVREEEGRARITRVREEDGCEHQEVREEDGRRRRSRVTLRDPEVEEGSGRMTRKSTEALREDEDRMFMLSLLSDLKQVPEDHKLDMRVEIINVVKKYKKLKKK